MNPLRWLRLHIRYWQTRETRRVEQIPARLAQFNRGELIPLKGTVFELADVRGGEFPCIILVPKGMTHGRFMHRLRVYRAGLKDQRQQQAATTRALKKATR